MAAQDGDYSLWSDGVANWDCTFDARMMQKGVGMDDIGDISFLGISHSISLCRHQAISSFSFFLILVCCFLSWNILFISSGTVGCCWWHTPPTKEFHEIFRSIHLNMLGKLHIPMCPWRKTCEEIKIRKYSLP